MAHPVAVNVKKKNPRTKKKEDSVNAILRFLKDENELPVKKKKEDEEDEELSFLFKEL